jgi:hypothetical protein
VKRRERTGCGRSGISLCCSAASRQLPTCRGLSDARSRRMVYFCFGRGKRSCPAVPRRSSKTRLVMSLLIVYAEPNLPPLAMTGTRNRSSCHPESHPESNPPRLRSSKKDEARFSEVARLISISPGRAVQSVDTALIDLYPGAGRLSWALGFSHPNLFRMNRFDER